MDIRKKAIYLFPVLIFLNTLQSPNQWNVFPIGNTTTGWLVNIAVIYSCFWYKNIFFYPANKRDYLSIWIYLLWVGAMSIKGFWIAEGYWEWKQCVSGTIILSLPLLVFPFSLPWLCRNVLKFWLRYTLPLFGLFFCWTVEKGSYQFLLGPIFLLGCFLPLIPTKWRYLLLGLLILMLLIDFGARSQVIKAAVALLISVGVYFRNRISVVWLRILFWGLCILPIVLLILGIAGIFNPFKDLSDHSGNFVEQTVINGEVQDDDLAADTRTFIYQEVINSAVTHHYLWIGRTPARGNDSEVFGEYNAEELHTGKYERHQNELCFPSVFTWLGVVGMLLYCFFYLKSAYLALYRSNNIYMKLVGIIIAFHFMYGWVEDTNSFDIINISLWMFIAMGFSEAFRKMTNKEYEHWLKRIF
ncbi:MAG: O-antigen ligase family protein [Chitinophagaceae bacterium]